MLYEVITILFGDDLFVRTPRGLAPTPLAESLAPRVRDALEAVEKLLRPQAPFSPRDSSRTFVIGMSDYAALAVLPGLLARLRLIAPGVRLLVRHTNRELGPGMLDAEEVELAVGRITSYNVCYTKLLRCLAPHGLGVDALAVVLHGNEDAAP